MLKRALSRVFFHVIKFFLKLLDGRLPRLYMRFYNALLKVMGVKMSGPPRYISTSVRFDDFDKISLGYRTVISEKVILLTHDYSVTTGLIALGKTPETDIAIIKDIVIGDNVFIGMGAIIMPGTIINDNVIIGAGSVVRGTIPEDSIVIGNPSKVIGTLSEKALLWEQNLKSAVTRVDVF